MEIAVNTLVVLILGVVILGGGIALVYKIFDSLKDMPDQVSREQEEKLFSILLGSKDRIAVLNNAREIPRGDGAVFPVGVQNELEGVSAKFQPKPGANPTVSPGDVCVSGGSSCPSLELIASEFELERYANKAFPVLVEVPKDAESGEYIFNIEIESKAQGASGFEYYARAKIYVTVE